MPQRFRIDRPLRLLYLGLALAGCTNVGVGKVEPSVMPIGAGPIPAERVRELVAATTPTEPQRLRLKFKFRDKKGQVGGNGGASIAPADSLRLDMRGPLGLGKGAAMVVGDSAVWVSGSDVINRIVPDYRLLWAMLGIARMPADSATLRGSETADTVAWEYATGTDTVEYRQSKGVTPGLVTLVRRNGKVLGKVETLFTPEGTPASSRLLVPGTPARLDITFTETTRPATLKPDIWTPPES